MVELIGRKARGAFYTPPEISRFLSRWAVRAKADTVLEPSCGDASFLIPIAEQLSALGASRPRIAKQLHGIDIHPPAIEGASRRLGDAGFTATLQTSDFFDCRADRQFDAVVGNPPFVRYQQFAGKARSKSVQAALAQGVRLTQLASAWAAFTVHASEFLKDDGRLGLVLPAELLSVNYASDVRRFLLGRFASLKLILFETLVFPGVLEEVVLLLAEGRGSATHFEVHQARDVSGLAAIGKGSWRDFTPGNDQRWTSAMLPSDAVASYDDALSVSKFARLSEWGETTLGIVTGNNSYFTLTSDEAADWKISADELVRISPPGARHLRGLSFTSAAWSSLGRAEGRCFLFAPASKPSRGAMKYIEFGEKLGVDKAYKCRVRDIWWRVPLMPTPDLFFTYMNHDRPRLTTNEAKVHILNSLYGVRILPLMRKAASAALPIACLNSLTLLGSEIVGRAYGGGLLKHEPREADRLPLPSHSLLSSCAEQLVALRPQLNVALRAGDLSRASALVDDVVLKKACRLTSGQIESVRAAREALFNRRVQRGKSSRADD